MWWIGKEFFGCKNRYSLKTVHSGTLSFFLVSFSFQFIVLLLKFFLTKFSELKWNFCVIFENDLVLCFSRVCGEFRNSKSVKYCGIKDYFEDFLLFIFFLCLSIKVQDSFPELTSILTSAPGIPRINSSRFAPSSFQKHAIPIIINDTRAKSRNVHVFPRMCLFKWPQFRFIARNNFCMQNRNIEWIKKSFFSEF